MNDDYVDMKQVLELSGKDFQWLITMLQQTTVHSLETSEKKRKKHPNLSKDIKVTKKKKWISLNWKIQEKKCEQQRG